MTDLSAAIAAAREALTLIPGEYSARQYAAALRNLLAALDAARGPYWSLHLDGMYALEARVRDAVSAMRYAEAAPLAAVPEGHLPVRRDVICFLSGLGKLDGLAFGEAPEGRGRYWWRTLLPAQDEMIAEAVTRMDAAANKENTRD